MKISHAFGDVVCKILKKTNDYIIFGFSFVAVILPYVGLMFIMNVLGNEIIERRFLYYIIEYKMFFIVVFALALNLLLRSAKEKCLTKKHSGKSN